MLLPSLLNFLNHAPSPDVDSGGRDDLRVGVFLIDDRNAALGGRDSATGASASRSAHLRSRHELVGVYQQGKSLLRESLDNHFIYALNIGEK